MTLLFALFVIVGFVFMFVSTWPGPSWATRVAWGSWLVAAIIWALPQFAGVH